MCLASTPEVNQTVAPPPSAAPKALASPYEDDLAGNLSQLRIGTGKGRKGGPKAARPDDSASAVAPPPTPAPVESGNGETSTGASAGGRPGRPSRLTFAQ